MKNKKHKPLKSFPSSEDIRKVGTSGSRGRYSKREKLDIILHVLNRTKEPLTPKEIALFTKRDPNLREIKPPTVRKYVRELLENHHVLRIDRGKYVRNLVRNPRVGVGGGCVWWGVHGVKVVVGFDGYPLPSVIPGVAVGFLEFRFGVGRKRGDRVTVDVIVPKRYQWIHGIDAVCWPFVVERIEDHIRRYCGTCPPRDQWQVTLLGVNYDILGYRLEGVSCLTVSQAGEILKRVYNKVWSAEGIRNEAHILLPVTPGDVEAILSGGVNTYNIKRNGDRLEGAFEKVNRELKYSNVSSWRVLKVAEELLRRREETLTPADIQTFHEAVSMFHFDIQEHIKLVNELREESKQRQAVLDWILSFLGRKGVFNIDLLREQPSPLFQGDPVLEPSTSGVIGGGTASASCEASSEFMGGSVEATLEIGDVHGLASTVATGMTTAFLGSD